MISFYMAHSYFSPDSGVKYWSFFVEGAMSSNWFCVVTMVNKLT